MHRCPYGKSAPALLVVLLVLAVLACAAASAQDALTARLLPQGGITIMSGEKLLATLSLNAHGPEWKHADQPAATDVVVKAADPGPGSVVEGSIPVPNTQGGTIRFVETVKPGPQGLTVGYTVGFNQAMTLNGLQVSLILPTDVYAGNTIAIRAPAPPPAEGEAAAPKTLSVALPEQFEEEKSQLAAAPGSSIEIAAGTPNAITVTPKLSGAKEGEAVLLPRFIVQDLRKWERSVFEVRLVLIMDDQGKPVAADEKMTVALDLAFAGAVQWQQ